MDEGQGDTQEPRTEQVGISVTKSEKMAVRAVASTLGIPESELLRQSGALDSIMERHKKIRAALSESGEAA